MASKKNNSKKKGKKSKSTSPVITCIRDGTAMKPFTEKAFKGHKCPTCGYFEGKLDPLPKKKRGVSLIECPECGGMKAMEIDDANRMGVLCCKCGYSAGRTLKRVANDQLSKLDEEIASIGKQLNPSLLKAK